MNKNELITAIAGETGFTKKDTEATIAAFVAIIKDELMNGRKVQMIGFGTFSVSDRAERKARNPKTGEEMIVPATKAPKFKPSQTLKDIVNV